jgi:hypothetical protein
VNVDKEVATGNVRQSNREAVKQPARPRTVITALLIPVGPTRDGGAVKKVVLPENASVVNFKLALITEDGNRNYQATLQTDDGRNIRTWTGLTSTRSNSAEVVSIRAPVNLFDQQSYNIMLKAVDASGIIRDINKYSFEVVKQPLRADRVR